MAKAIKKRPIVPSGKGKVFNGVDDTPPMASGASFVSMPYQRPPRYLRIWGTIAQYCFLASAGVGIYWLYRIGFWHSLTQLPPMTGPAVLFFALSFSFTWVEVLHWGVTKPFNCVKCMTGWTALIFAFMFHVPHPYLYLFAGLFVGAMYEGVKMRYL